MCFNGHTDSEFTFFFLHIRRALYFLVKPGFIQFWHKKLSSQKRGQTCVLPKNAALGRANLPEHKTEDTTQELTNGLYLFRSNVYS